MRFKYYLAESDQTNNIFGNYAKLVYQQILDNVDSAYVDYQDTRLSMDIGRVIKDSRISNLLLVIRSSPSDDIKLGKTGSGIFAIVIDTTEFPERQEIDKFLGDNLKLYKNFVELLSTYIKKYATSHTEHNPAYSNEFETIYNDPKRFEEQFNNLMQTINMSVDNFNKSKHELQKETANHSKRAISNMALIKLKNDHFGSTFKEFIKLISKLKEFDFAKHLRKELQQKLNNRLQDYYDTYIVKLANES